MKYVITFQRTTGRYAVHAFTCSAAKETRTQARVEFSGTLPEAVVWCHLDESDKAGKSVKAAVKVCGCCK